MYLTSAKKLGFTRVPLYLKKEPHALHYLKQQVSFWIAIFSLVAFVVGNMVGQYGWHVFWSSVLGAVDDSGIVYTGTALPIEAVPDYERWALLGGNVREHSFREVPQDLLIALPQYDSTVQSHDHDYGDLLDVYSIGNLGSYATGAENSGSHPGVDIMVPIGTPVHSIANGVVESVGNNSGGYGKVVVIRHPNVPDPDNLRATTTLYSVYAHLSTIFVTEGQIVEKGQTIAQSGDTGFATGPHLHFQIDRDTAPWHPYWPFSDSEARAEGMTFVQAVDSGLFQSRGRMYTINPMTYIQANLNRIVADASGNTQSESSSSSSTSVSSSSSSSAPSQSTIETRKELISLLLQRRNHRIESRIARRQFSDRIVASNTDTTTSTVESVTQQASTENIVTDTSTSSVESSSSSQSSVAESSSSSSVESSSQPSAIARVQISHDGSFSGKGWEAIRITLLDDEGNRVVDLSIDRTMYLFTAYGDAEFRPSALTVDDFENGIAELYMLPRGKRTVVIGIQPFVDVSKPMEYKQ